MKCFLFVSTLILLSTAALHAQSYTDPGNARSDTVDVLHTDITMDFSNPLSTEKWGRAAILLRSKMNGVDQLHFDLLSMLVDSITSFNTPALQFSQNGASLFISLSEVLNTDDTLTVVVYYHGTPALDPSWGGFYQVSGYTYNLGVGFDSDPHCFGRAWFPCFDSFVERCTFSFQIETIGAQRAYCNGTRTGIDTLANGHFLSHWHLRDPIPSYLAGIAVSAYTHVASDYTSVTGDTIPVWLVAQPTDTLNMSASFGRLHQWLAACEEAYGPFVFERVGFVAVPFGGGAMEHATNIAYPTFAIAGGSLDYETLWAHELSHHWWGDHTTCRTEEDMWLNEGWASYNEVLFLEKAYSRARAIDYLRNNHKNVVFRAHQQDGGYYPVSGVPHHITYGSHVYEKGRDVVHNLRTHMGDSAFFAACKEVQNNFGFKDIGSEELKGVFQQHTARDLDLFFNQWIYRPGFVDFRISSMQKNLPYVNLTISQQLRETEEWYQDVSINIHFTNGAQSWDTAVVCSGISTNLVLRLPSDLDPSLAWLNDDEGTVQSVLGQTKWIQDTGLNSFSFAEAGISCTSLGEADSLLLRIENHVSPAWHPIYITGTDWYVSPDRWWSVAYDSTQAPTLAATFRFFGSSSGTNYYDEHFFSDIFAMNLTENDIALLHRPLYSNEWQEFGGTYTINTQGSATNGTGTITIDSLPPGDYAWAVHTGTVKVEDTAKSNQKIFYKPNSHKLYLQGYEDQRFYLTLYDVSGRMLRQWKHIPHSGEVELPALSQGHYLLKMDKVNEHSVFRFFVE
jgi:aminopeptidase N